MAVDSYMIFTPYNGSGGFGAPLTSESHALLPAKDLAGFVLAPATGFSIADFSFDIDQTLAIGSAGSGTGAGKVKFNPFSVTRNIDKLSPVLFQHCCTGQAFAKIDLLQVRPAATAGAAGLLFLQYTFKLAAVATLATSYGEEGPKEAVTFQYADLQIRYAQQKIDGSFLTPVVAGWDIVKGAQDLGTSATV
ncbi:MAG: type secretion system secreted protein Hcp [Frankiales bacterium]|jgi:type VI secretion system secreted protein Hcp|nr:type secretion system secreted protein Hcp [Frankiales bacterium]MDX6221698.1 type secretion system secreted protein Hcp [Frankiales bacterium]